MSVVFPINVDPRFRISTAAGGETTYSVPFPFQDNADITVQKVSADGLTTTTLAEPADYTLTGAGNPSGGTVSLVVAAVAGEKFLRKGAAVLDRLTSIARNGRFSSSAIDDDLDRNRIVQQEEARDIGQAAHVALGSAAPLITVGADGKVVAWLGGNLVPVDPGSVTLATPADLSVTEPKLAAALALLLSSVSATRAALKALDTTRYRSAYLAEAGREGMFVWKAADYSAAVAADTSEGIYLKANAIATTAGAWVRAAYTNLDPRWFGAIGDGSTDDTTAMQACATFASTYALPILVPALTFSLTAQIVTTSGRIEIVGADLRKSALLWTSGAATRGWKTTLGATGGLRDTFRARNLSFLTAGAGSGTGLRIIDTTPADRFNPAVVINNIVVSGATNPTNDGWSNAIWCDGCQGTFIDGAYIWGKVGAGGVPNYDSVYGILFNNAGAASPHPTECQIINCSIKTVTTAIYADDMEGLVVSDCQIVGVVTGVNAHGLAGYPDVRISNNHINAASNCVVVDLMYQATIIGNLFYNQLQGSTATGINIINAASFFNISHNTFECYHQTIAANSIVVANGLSGLIDGNIFRRSNSIDGTAHGTAVWLTSNASNVKVTAANVFGAAADVFTPVLDQGTSNAVAFPSSISTLTTDFTGGNVSTVQPVFSSGQDEFTALASTTYEFEAEYFITRAAGTTSHTTAVLLGGTATFTSIGYLAEVANPTGDVLSNVQSLWCASAAAQTLTAANTSATENLIIKLRGLIRVSAAGTIIPQLQYSAAPGGAPTIKANSFFRMTALGSDTRAAVGAWS